VQGVTNGGLVQVSLTSKGHAPRPSTFHGVRSAKKIDNFLRELKAYFRAMGIEDDA